MTTVREATFALLRQHGMTTMFGNPGSNELLFLTEFPEDFRYILGLHEGAVMAMADGFSQAGGSLPLVSLHSAAGLGTSMGVLANTVQSKTPVVVLSGQQVRSMVGQDIMVASAQATMLPQPLTKWSAEPLDALDVVRSFGEAIHRADAHPKGPTHLSVPYDDWDCEVDANTDRAVTRRVVDASALSEAHLAELIVMIDAASSPALVYGSEVDATDAFDAGVRLAERLGAPTWIAPSPGRCPFPTTHALFAGVLPANVSSIASALAPHDLVVVIGAPVFRYHHNHPGDYLAAGTKLVHISQDPAEIARAPFGDAYFAPVADSIDRLARHTRQRTATVVTRETHVAGTDEPGRMAPDTVFQIIDEVTPEDAIHVVESTSTAAAFWNNISLSRQGSFYSAAAGGLGFGLPAAVGVALAQPARRVIAEIGDGSANYGITGLWSAAQHNVPVIFVILRNETYGALVNFGKRLEATELPSFELSGIDFVALAEGYGVKAERVSTAADLRAALSRALTSPHPVLIEALTHHH